MLASTFLGLESIGLPRRGCFCRALLSNGDRRPQCSGCWHAEEDTCFLVASHAIASTAFSFLVCIRSLGVDSIHLERQSTPLLRGRDVFGRENRVRVGGGRRRFFL